MDTPGAPEIPDNRGLDEFATEAAPATTTILSRTRADTATANSTPRSFSRLEAAHKRRARSSVVARMGRNAGAWRERLLQAAGAVSGYLWTAVAWLALRLDSLSYRAARIAHRSRRARGLAAAPSAAPVPPASNAVPAASHNEVEDLESEGSFIAAALALAVVGYGGLLLMSWRDPLPRVSAASVAPPLVTVAGAPAPEPALVASATTAPDPTGGMHAVIRGGSPATHDPRRAQPRVSAATLEAIWNRSDTSSLQNALTSLRHETLAFHRCGMKMTGIDHAVARCDGSSRVYTIDFRRASGRWMIQRVSSR